jgi:hypothetical protein
VKKSISNVLAGGLITSATVMGVDAVQHPVSAATMTTTQTLDFDFNFADSAATCCFNNSGSNQFVFGGFDSALGKLRTADLALTITGLTNDPNANTCCFNLDDVLGYDGQIAGQDLTDAVVRDLGEGGFTVMLDASQFRDDQNTVTLDFNLLFNDMVFVNGETKGFVALNYIFEPIAVPIPGSAALLTPSMIALLAAAGASGRRRRSKGEE